ncbi:MAG: AtpZ/AtpI family protein [Hymenobacter sp.]|nr:AtpZ/AtpI family protein [Hymenobacter sp.]
MAASPPPKPVSPPPRGGNFAKYSGLGIQMLAIIGLGTWLGIWLDGRFGIGPWGTVVLMLLSVFMAMYQVIRAVSGD